MQGESAHLGDARAHPWTRARWPSAPTVLVPPAQRTGPPTQARSSPKTSVLTTGPKRAGRRPRTRWRWTRARSPPKTSVPTPGPERAGPWPPAHCPPAPSTLALGLEQGRPQRRACSPPDPSALAPDPSALAAGTERTARSPPAHWAQAPSALAPRPQRAHPWPRAWSPPDLPRLVRQTVTTA
jgi:hypothetical protein